MIQTDIPQYDFEIIFFNHISDGDQIFLCNSLISLHHSCGRQSSEMKLFFDTLEDSHTLDSVHLPVQ